MSCQRTDVGPSSGMKCSFLASAIISSVLLYKLFVLASRLGFGISIADAGLAVDSRLASSWGIRSDPV